MNACKSRVAGTEGVRAKLSQVTFGGVVEKVTGREEPSLVEMETIWSGGLGPPAVALKVTLGIGPIVAEEFTVTATTTSTSWHGVPVHVILRVPALAPAVRFVAST